MKTTTCYPQMAALFKRESWDSVTGGKLGKRSEYSFGSC